MLNSIKAGIRPWNQAEEHSGRDRDYADLQRAAFRCRGDRYKEPLRLARKESLQSWCCKELRVLSLERSSELVLLRKEPRSKKEGSQVIQARKKHQLSKGFRFSPSDLQVSELKKEECEEVLPLQVLQRAEKMIKD